MSEILVEVSRGSSVENIHRGNIAVVNLRKKLAAWVGEPYKRCFMRSCSKPIQAIAVLETGAAEYYGLSDREIAVMCASHYSESFHVEAVLSILHKLGLEESHLRCGATYSINEKVTAEHIRKGFDSRKVFNNCSGKHAGMLAMALKEGYAVENYEAAENPVQLRMLQTMSDFAEVALSEIGLGIDGCGVPVYELPLYNMALAFAKLSCPEGLSLERQQAVKRVIKSMTAYPEMVAGTDGFCTELMRHTGGRLVAKLGADAVYCVSDMEKGLGLALKIEDGNLRVLSCAVVEALWQLGLLREQELDRLKPFHIKQNQNTLGDKVGEIRPVLKLKTE